MHKAVTSTKTFVHCPNCGEQAGSIDHLFEYGREFKATWGCDSCGSSYDLLVDGRERVEVGINNARGAAVPCLHVLALRPKPYPVFAVISAKDYGREGQDKAEPFASAEYFYNEHTCPTNWTGDIEMLIAKGDGDPHGLFEYVESIDLPPDVDVEEFIHRSFPHLFEVGDSQKTNQLT